MVSIVFTLYYLLVIPLECRVLAIGRHDLDTGGAHHILAAEVRVMMICHPNAAPPVSVITRAGCPPWTLLAAHRILELGGISVCLLEDPG